MIWLSDICVLQPEIDIPVLYRDIPVLHPKNDNYDASIAFKRSAHLSSFKEKYS